LISKHIEGTTIGDKRLSAVRASEIQAWVTDRAKVLSPTTVRLLVQTLRSVFNAAVQDRLIASSPVARLSLPRSENARIVPLTVAQVQALADAMPDRCRAMIIIQAGLGLRIAELLALRLEDVDFLRRTVRVEWQLTQGGKHRVLPKTPRSRRTMPLPPWSPKPWRRTSRNSHRLRTGPCSPRPAGTYTGRSTSVLACLSQRPRVQAYPLASPRTT
jgi:integrase